MPPTRLKRRTEGVVGLSRWFEKMKSVFEISKCAEEDKNDLKNMMTAEYCPRTEIQKIEQELWTLSMKGDDIDGYTDRFYELVVMCPTLVTPEYKKIERYVSGLLERIQGNVTSSKPTNVHEAICMASELVDQSVRAKATRITKQQEKVGRSTKKQQQQQQQQP
ncbi:putative reverse transcriptase domain-containing protein [Tanacetum coccineum]